MDLSKLEMMGSDTLQAIRDKCVEVLAARRENSLRRGATAWFIDSKGVKRTMLIERINSKTVSGREIDPITRQYIGSATWRVTPALLNVVGEKRPTPVAPTPIHKPSTTADNAW